jgi:hypothetical protein
MDLHRIASAGEWDGRLPSRLIPPTAAAIA